MSEHEASRVVQAPRDTVFALVADPARLPEWLPTVQEATPSLTGEGTEVVDVEGEAGGSHYQDRGYWRPEAVQLRVEWGSPSRGGAAAPYAGWLQVADQAGGGCEVTAHLSFFDESVRPDGVEAGLAQALNALAGLVER
ncbi:MAG: Polyketide cyclase/dehydrase [Frankiales bacterium]|jgi:uncharacterized protein YndB with AHSA1/START domain|nr:Polyketide cyclase/dehydrase [Frankiales bacterium]